MINIFNTKLQEDRGYEEIKQRSRTAEILCSLILSLLLSDVKIGMTEADS